MNRPDHPRENHPRRVTSDASPLSNPRHNTGALSDRVQTFRVRATPPIPECLAVPPSQTRRIPPRRLVQNHRDRQHPAGGLHVKRLRFGKTATQRLRHVRVARCIVLSLSRQSFASHDTASTLFRARILSSFGHLSRLSSRLAFGGGRNHAGVPQHRPIQRPDRSRRIGPLHQDLRGAR